MIGAEPARTINTRYRYVQVKLNIQTGECLPLRHRLEVIDRLGGLDLDHAHKLAGTLRGQQYQVRVPRRLGRPNGRRLLVPRINGDFELSLVLRLEQADNPIVLELLAHGPHEDRAQQNLRRVDIPRR